MIICLLPFVVIGLAYSIEYEEFYQSLSALGITAALTYFLSHLGRDLGKKKEPELWKSWGGPPSSQLLSYGNDEIDPITKDRYHSRMKDISKFEKDIDFHNSSLEKLIDIYESWVRILIAKTRDRKQYPLIFEENVGYGFRRNLWALKPYAIGLAILSVLGNYVFQLITHGFTNIDDYPVSFFISEIVLIGMIAMWMYVITDNWVRVPASAYGKRLLEAIDTIHPDRID